MKWVYNVTIINIVSMRILRDAHSPALVPRALRLRLTVRPSPEMPLIEFLFVLYCALGATSPEYCFSRAGEL